MKVKQSLALGALVALPFAAIAQSQLQPNPLAANETVPALTYVSAFQNYQAAADSQTTPAQGWRAANNEVARLGGHAGHITGSAKVASTAEPASSPDKPRMPSPMPPMRMDHSEHRHH